MQTWRIHIEMTSFKNISLVSLYISSNLVGHSPVETWLIDMWGVTHPWRHDSSICGTWLLHRDMTHSYRDDVFQKHQPGVFKHFGQPHWSLSRRTMTHLYVGRDSFIETWLVYRKKTSLKTLILVSLNILKNLIGRSHVETWLIYIWDVTPSYVTWLNYRDKSSLKNISLNFLDMGWLTISKLLKTIGLFCRISCVL